MLRTPWTKRHDAKTSGGVSLEQAEKGQRSQTPRPSVPSSNKLGVAAKSHRPRLQRPTNRQRVLEKRHSGARTSAAMGGQNLRFLLLFVATVILTVLTLKYTHLEVPSRPSRSIHMKSSNVQVIFTWNQTQYRPRSHFQHPETPLPTAGDDEETLEPVLESDFGGLNLTFQGYPRRISATEDSFGMQTIYRLPDTPLDDDVGFYYAMDDDWYRNLAVDGPKTFDRAYPNNRCRRFAEHTLSFPTCNTVHEIDRVDIRTNLKFINKGGFREVFGIDLPAPVGGVDRHHASAAQEGTATATTRMVIKDLRYDRAMDTQHYEYIRMDAIVAERLTASPRIYDIYGFCGLGIVSEFFDYGDMEDRSMGGDFGFMSRQAIHVGDEAQPQNNLTGIQKLVLGLEMAEALADLHGYQNGLIVHNDIQTSQFLLNPSKTRLKLNDFNRAEFVLFNEEQQEYCKYRNGMGHGNWRSPEEYNNAPLTEQIDVWSLGNNLLALLTGLNPMYDLQNFQRFKNRIKAGIITDIDIRYEERSEEERVLRRIIPHCYRLDPQDRPSIFTLVAWLGEATDVALTRHGTTREAVLRGV